MSISNFAVDSISGSVDQWIQSADSTSASDYIVHSWLASESIPFRFGHFCHDLALQPRLDEQRHEGQQRQQRGHCERTGEVVFLKQLLDAERDRIRLAGNVARDDIHRAELA